MKDLLKKIPLWMAVSAVLFVALALSFSQKTGNSDEVATKSIEEIGEITVDYINNVFLQGMDSVNLIDVTEEEGVYKIKVKLGDQEIDVYATKNGKLFFPEAFNMEEIPEVINEDESQEEVIEQEDAIGQEESGENTETSIDAIELINCLNEKNFVIYGAEWCPHCRDLVNMFGGYDKANSIYVECTENEDLCRGKNIESYPTILINDQPYRGERSFEAFASETNCQL